MKRFILIKRDINFKNFDNYVVKKLMAFGRLLDRLNYLSLKHRPENGI